ncbi:hypothetical protein AB6A40_011771, partial [Gnathostoma spinigerum]
SSDILVRNAVILKQWGKSLHWLHPVTFKFGAVKNNEYWYECRRGLGEAKAYSNGKCHCDVFRQSQYSVL